MSAAHTPGPWVVHSAYPWIIKQYMGVPFCEPDDGVTICNTTGLDGSGFFPSAKEGLANARLIAAAPELLEALQNMHNVLKEAMSTGGWIPTPVQGSFRDAWVEVTGSIAKATGAQA